MRTLIPPSYSPWAALIGLLIVAASCTSCATVEKDKKTNSLQASASGYQSALRWGYYETAYGYLHPDLRRDKPLPDYFKGLRLTGYEVVQPPVVQDDNTATQLVVIDYLFEDTQVVKQLTDRQTWRWDPTLKSWWLQSGLPNFASAKTP